MALPSRAAWASSTPCGGGRSCREGHAGHRPRGLPTAFVAASRARQRATWPLAAGDGAAYHAAANRHIVARRHEISRRKKEARRQARDRDRERNLRLRHLFSEEKRGTQSHDQEGGAGAGDAGPPMFAVKVVACPTLRAELKMTGREKRGRMFVERPASFPSSSCEEAAAAPAEEPATSLKALRQTIHEFFRRLKKSTYLLSARLPELDEEGNVLTRAEGAADDADAPTWPLESDEDVTAAFLRAEDHFLSHRANNETSALRRPTLVLHVTKDPHAPPPPPTPPYLVGMADPAASPSVTMLSFYSFPPDGGVADPEDALARLRRLWRPFGARGRVYVAREGVNAQMAVPTNVLDRFLACCTRTAAEGGELSDVLGRHMENGMNVDPIPVAMDEFQRDPPFKNLHLRVRRHQDCFPCCVVCHLQRDVTSQRVQNL